MDIQALPASRHVQNGISMHVQERLQRLDIQPYGPAGRSAGTKTTDISSILEPSS